MQLLAFIYIKKHSVTSQAELVVVQINAFKIY